MTHFQRDPGFDYTHLLFLYGEHAFHIELLPGGQTKFQEGVESLKDNPKMVEK